MSRIKWSKQRVIEELRKGYGKTPSTEREPVSVAARKHFGSMENALRAAGVKSARHTWTRARVLEQIQAEFPAKGTGVWCEGGLSQAIYHYFPTRAAALEAAGFRSPTPQRKRWSPEIIIEALQCRADRNAWKGVSKKNQPLYQAAIRHFGSWSKALDAAGFGKKTWTKALVIEVILERYRLNQPLKKVKVEDSELLSACRRLFGGWQKALRAAGLDQLAYRKWTRKKVIAGLKALRDQPHSLTQNYRKALYRANLRYFGSWSAALATVGLTCQIRQQWSKGRVLSEIRDWYRRTGGDRSQLPEGLRCAIYKYWETLSAVIQAAGFDLDVSRKWSPQLIIHQLQNRYVAGQPIRRPCDVEASLANAARHYFGSWQQALEASGIKLESQTSLPTRAGAQDKEKRSTLHVA